MFKPSSNQSSFILDSIFLLCVLLCEVNWQMQVPCFVFVHGDYFLIHCSSQWGSLIAIKKGKVWCGFLYILDVGLKFNWFQLCPCRYSKRFFLLFLVKRYNHYFLPHFHELKICEEVDLIKESERELPFRMFGFIGGFLEPR